jgi:hypothetical protein
MKDKLVLDFLLFGIVEVVLLVLTCWIEWLRGGGLHKRPARTRPRHAVRAHRGFCSTTCGPVALPEHLARRWNGPYLYRNDLETMAALSVLVCDDIKIMSGGSDREVQMCLRWLPQTRRGQLRPPKLGPVALN